MQHIQDTLESKTNSYLTPALTMLAIFTLINTVSFVLFAVMDNYFVLIKDEWLEQIEKKGCGDKISGGFHYLSLKELGQINAFLGGYLGLLFQ